MRRTSICSAIIALLLCGQTLGQVLKLPDEKIAPGIAAPVPQVGQPVPEMVIPIPSTTPAVPPAPPAKPQTTATPQQVQAQGDQSLLQSQANGGAYHPTDGQNVWNRTMQGGPNEEPCVYPGCALCGAGTACPKQWYIDQRLRIMKHPKPRTNVFGSWHTTQSIPTIDGNVTIDVYTPCTTSSSLPFDLSSSYEFTLGHYLGLDTHNRDHFLEFTFFGTNHWSNHGAVRSTRNDSGILDVSDDDPPVVTDYGVFGNINGGPSGAAGFNRANAQSSEYGSWQDNYEVNLQIKPRANADRLVLLKNGKWRRQCQEGIFCNWLAGVRLFSMGERYKFKSSSEIDYYTDADPDNPYATSHSEASYRTRSYNTLLGMQIGPDWTYRKCRASCGVGVKAGGFINFAKQESWINISGAAEDRFSNGEDMDFAGSATRNTSAAMIEMDFHAEYKVRPNFILKASYELMYIAGLALAPEQVEMNNTILGPNPPMVVGTGGTLLFQSATFGAELVW